MAMVTEARFREILALWTAAFVPAQADQTQLAHLGRIHHHVDLRTARLRGLTKIRGNSSTIV